MRHRLVRASYESIDLISFRAEQAIIARQVICAGTLAASATLESEGKTFDRAQRPGDPGREQWVHECIRMRQEHPARACGARETMLNAGPKHHGHQRRGVGEGRMNRGIA